MCGLTEFLSFTNILMHSKININLKLYSTKYDNIILSSLYLRFSLRSSLFICHIRIFSTYYQFTNALSLLGEARNRHEYFTKMMAALVGIKSEVGRISSLVANIKISK